MSRRRWEAIAFEPLPWAPIVGPEVSAAEQQRAVLCDRPGPHLLVAGPGAGKTRCLVAEVRRRAEVDPFMRAAVLTFTVAGSRVLEARLRDGPGSRRVRVGRTQQLMFQAFRQAHLDRKTRPTVHLISGTTVHHLLARAIREAGDEPAGLEDLTRKAARSIEDLAPLAEDVAEVVTPTVFDRYAVLKAQDKAVDQGDVRRWAMAHVEAIAEGWIAEGYTEIYLDEAQDSSPAEIALMVAAARRGLRVCCVLDPRQSLYEWRGARVQELLDALWELDGAHVHVLTVNRRSAERPVATLNAFSAWAFEGESARPMAALRPGGEPFRAVVCPEGAVVKEGLASALAAVDGLPRSRAPGSLRPDRSLRDAVGLPAVIGAGQSIAVLTATGKEAEQIKDQLVKEGFDPILLVSQMDDSSATELLHGVLDPVGSTGGPALTYGAASPICLLLTALRHQKPFVMKTKSEGAEAIDDLIVRLRRAGRTGQADPVKRFWATWKSADVQLAAWARRPARTDGRSDRLRAFAIQARAALGEWAAVLEECPSACACAKHLDTLLDLASAYVLVPKPGTVDPHPVVASVRRLKEERDGAGRLLQWWADQPHLGKEDVDGEPPAGGPPALYVAVVNQVKGDEFTWVVISALREQTFPFKGEDCDAERRRWWVAISRAAEGTAYLGVRDNDLYWPPRAKPVG